MAALLEVLVAFACLLSASKVKLRPLTCAGLGGSAVVPSKAGLLIACLRKNHFIPVSGLCCLEHSVAIKSIMLKSSPTKSDPEENESSPSVPEAD